MKANGKEKTPIVAAATVASTEDPSLEASSKQQTDQAKDSSVASAAESEGSVDDSKDSATTQPTADQDEDMKEASPITTDVIEEDTPMAEPAPIVKPRELPSGIPEGIDQEDLDGGLLDGALDDYDDLDQDTEDTEVGNGDDDFSDDDDDDDDLDGPLLDSTDKTNHYSDAQTPGATSHADTAKSEEPDSDDEMNQDERDEALQTEDSDSDLGDLDASDNDQDDDDDDDDEGDADGEDGDDDDDDEEEEEIKPPVKKDTVLSQKPTLHRPSITEEELKDSGDELSDLSEFDDTDDSDEDDDIPEPKPAVKEAPISAPPASPTAATAPTGSTAASTTGPAAPTTTTLKPTLGGRKRSLHEATVEPVKPEDESIKSEQEDQVQIPIPSGRARLSEPGSRKRRVSEVEDTQPSDKESESEVAEEEEEAEKTTKEEDEGEGEEDHEMKQLHKDALDALTSIEIEFASLRDKYVSGTKSTLLLLATFGINHYYDLQFSDIGTPNYIGCTHPELSSLMQEIEQKREHRLHIADMGRKHKTDIAQNAHDVTVYQAHCTFQSARRNTRTQMVNDMGKKRRQINLEFNLSFDARKRKLTTATPDKAVLLRARKHKRAEVNELKSISEKRGFPTSGKLSTVTQAELQDDFALMGLARLLPQPKPAGVDPQVQHQHQHQHHQQHQQQRHGGPLPPSIPISAGASSLSRHGSNSRWPSVNDYPPPPPPNMPPTGTYYGGRSDVEIYVDGSRCMVDGIWYKPNDAVVVLDASIGKYNAKYVSLESDWIVLQRTDGSKTRLHLSLFRGRKLCMQPKV
ncbi:hypothetical protein EC957_011025 [Mortierella hygrophila]|uniref:Uncharacterized protein n=1 Tax=Mortierella hygrophila TaxID=979708 RepID=A0A9P6F970_9FUNG|nr:hypothetical protein EC957_011025 [Mortierella hygrophila]